MRRGGSGLAMRAVVLQYLQDTTRRRNWAHAGLALAIRNLGIDEARWSPPGGHSVWEQINHVRYWKRYILQRIQRVRTKARQAWPAGGRTPADLRKATADLAALHRALRAAVLALDPDDLQEPRGARYPLVQLLLGAAAHESYHAGQIFLTRKLYRRHRRSR
jgi:uncharacterized damage-inducible protein DinB